MRKEARDGLEKVGDDVATAITSTLVGKFVDWLRTRFGKRKAKPCDDDKA